MRVELVKDATFILVAAGAGFSGKDLGSGFIDMLSGFWTSRLRVGVEFAMDLSFISDIARVEAYEQLGLDYQDLCDPGWIQYVDDTKSSVNCLSDDPEIALGFWGGCLNMYRDVTEHEGWVDVDCC